MSGEDAPSGAEVTLQGFLAARLDEDEAAARAAAAADGKYGGRPHWSARFDRIVTDEADPDWAIIDLGPCIDDDSAGAHVARHDPARVLREVAAGRAILAAYEAVLKDCSTVGAPGRRPRKYGEYDGLHLAVSNLAAVYSDHPEYRDEWKP